MDKIKYLQWGDTFDPIDWLNKGLNKSSTLIEPTSYQRMSNVNFKREDNLKPLAPITPFGGKVQALGKQKLESKVYPTTKKTSGFASMFSKGNVSNTMGTVGSAADLISSAIPNNYEDPTRDALNQGYDAASSAIMAIPGWGTIIGGGMKALGALGKGLDNLTGGATTIKDPTLGADKVLSSNFFKFTPISALNTATKTKITGSDTDIAKTINKGYNPTAAVGTTEIGGVTNMFKKLFTGKNAVKDRQNLVNKTNTENIQKSVAISNDAKNNLAAGNTMYDIANKNYQKQRGGLNTSVLAAKKGISLLSLKNIKNEAQRKFKKGGELKLLQTKEVNLLPTGEAHSRLNKLPEEIAPFVTNKGIPVISKSVGGEITQHAEIESAEWIAGLKLTKELERLHKEYEDGNEEAALIAGKLLVSEILENTIDKSQLIEKII